MEVKSTLTAGELRSAYDNALTIQNYSYLSGSRIKEGERATSRNVKKAISTLFALSSDLTVGGKTELERLTALNGGGDPPIRALCVSGRGYWYYTDEWRHIAMNDEHRETMSFIVGLIDTLSEVGLSRQQPGLVAYLMDDLPMSGGPA